MKQAINRPKQKRAFCNNYTAAFFIVAATIFSNTSFAQTRAQLQRNNAFGYNYINGAYRGLFYIPLDTLSTSDSGAVAYLNGSFYFKNNIKWTAVSGADQFLTSTRIAFGNGSNKITDDADFTYSQLFNRLDVGTGNFADSLQVGKMRIGTALDSFVVRDPITKALMIVAPPLQNSNAGLGYRILKPGDQSLKSLFNGWGFLYDSTMNTDGLTGTVDSATLSLYFMRRKDSGLYVTVSQLRDTSLVLRSLISNTTHWQLNGSNNLVPKSFAGNRVEIAGKQLRLIDSGFVAIGVGGGVHPSPGPGFKMFWHPGKAAFRAGFVTAAAYDDVNIGNASAAFGLDAAATGLGSFAAGNSVAATADGATALGGASTTASGQYSFASGNSVVASGGGAAALGVDAEATGAQSFATGNTTVAQGDQSASFNFFTHARAAKSAVFGNLSTTNVTNRIPQFSIGWLNDTVRSAELFRIGWPTASAGRNNIFSVDTLGRTKIGKLDDGNSGDSVVVWRASDSTLRKVAQSSISGGGGGTPMAIGNWITGATLGSILYAGTNGALQQSNANFFFDSTNIRLGLGTNSPQRLFHSSLADAGTNAVSFVGRYDHITSGTATTGFGLGRELRLENASGALVTAATETFSYSDAVNATEDATWTINLVRAGSLQQAMTVSSIGALTTSNSIVSGGSVTVGTSNLLTFGTRSVITSPADGNIRLTNSLQNNFGLLLFGGTTSSFFGIKRSGTIAQFRLGDDTDFSDIEIKGRAYDATTWNGSNRGVSEDAVRDQVELMKSRPWSATHTYTITTSDATPTNLTAVYGAMDIPNASTGWIRVVLSGNASNGATTHGLKGIKYYSFNKAGGTLTLDAADVIVADKKGASVTTATWQLTTSSNQPVIEVTGIAGTMRWVAAVEVLYIID